MKIINNNPSVEAAIGKICSTTKPISFEMENCLYLLPSIKKEIADKVEETISNQMKIAKLTGDFLGSYTCTCLHEKLHIEDENIQEAIEKEGCNVILPLNFLGREGHPTTGEWYPLFIRATYQTDSPKDTSQATSRQSRRVQEMAETTLLHHCLHQEFHHKFRTLSSQPYNGNGTADGSHKGNSGFQE